MDACARGAPGERGEDGAAVTADFPAVMRIRVKDAPTYDHFDPGKHAAWARIDSGLDLLSNAMGKLSRAIDDDAQLLCMAGIELDRMRLQRYQADPLRTSLLVDGKVVREYTLRVIGVEP